MTWTQIPETVDHEHRLGRHIHRPEGFYDRVSPEGEIRTVSWTRHVAPYNQGDLGSCTGNAAAGALMTDPFWLPGRFFQEQQAVEFYSDATHFNENGEVYPPNDDGSSGPAVAEALERLQLVSNYGHATNLQDALKGLSTGPGIFGVNWYTSFDSPLDTGECALDPAATVRGGHEVQAFAVNTKKQRVWFYQSWGPKWGGLNDGTFWFSYDTLNTLFEQGADATFFVGTKNVNPVVATQFTGSKKSWFSKLIQGLRSIEI